MRAPAHRGVHANGLPPPCRLGLGLDPGRSAGDSEATNTLATDHLPTLRLGVLAACPHYAHAALYRRLAGETGVELTAVFASSGGIRPEELGYGHPISWDVDLLSGYRSVFLRNAARTPVEGGFCALRDPDVVRVLRRERFDVLWLHGYNSLLHMTAALTQRVLGGRLLFRENQTLLHRRPLLKASLKALGLRALFRLGAGMYVGTRNRRWFEHYGVPSERLFFTPYTVDDDAFAIAAQKLTPQRAVLRREFGIPETAGPVILSVTRLIPKKQPLALIEAFRRLRERRRCCLLIVGSGELEAAVRSRIAEMGIPDVYLAGFVPQSQIARAYAAADVFVLFSHHHETWGLVVNEALHFGLPVIVSDVVGAGLDLVRDGHSGFVVDRADTEALASRLEAMIDNPQLRARMGAAGTEIVQAWNIERTAEGVLAAVRAAAKYA